MPVLLGAALLAVFVLLSVSAAEGDEGRKRSQNALLGALGVGAVVFVLAKAGFGWLGLGLALLFGAAKRYSGNRATAPTEARTSAGPGSIAAPMTRDEAFQVLGLKESATRSEIVAEYRRLMKKVHPDQGGTTYLAARLNQAKDVLLGD